MPNNTLNNRVKEMRDNVKSFKDELTLVLQNKGLTVTNTDKLSVMKRKIDEELNKIGGGPVDPGQPVGDVRLDPNIVTYELEMEWDHGTNQDGTTPDYSSATLYAGNRRVCSATLYAETSWKYTFYVNKFDENGDPIIYSLVGDPPTGYTAGVVDGHKIVNKFVEQLTLWADTQLDGFSTASTVRINHRILDDGTDIIASVSDSYWTVIKNGKPFKISGSSTYGYNQPFISKNGTIGLPYKTGGKMSRLDTSKLTETTNNASTQFIGTQIAMPSTAVTQIYYLFESEYADGLIFAIANDTKIFVSRDDMLTFEEFVDFSDIYTDAVTNLYTATMKPLYSVSDQYNGPICKVHLNFADKKTILFLRGATFVLDIENRSISLFDYNDTDMSTASYPNTSVMYVRKDGKEYITTSFTKKVTVGGISKSIRGVMEINTAGPAPAQGNFSFETILEPEKGVINNNFIYDTSSDYKVVYGSNDLLIKVNGNENYDKKWILTDGKTVKATFTPMIDGTKEITSFYKDVVYVKATGVYVTEDSSNLYWSSDLNTWTKCTFELNQLESTRTNYWKMSDSLLSGIRLEGVVLCDNLVFCHPYTSSAYNTDYTALMYSTDGKHFYNCGGIHLETSLSGYIRYIYKIDGVFTIGTHYSDNGKEWIKYEKVTTNSKGNITYFPKVYLQSSAMIVDCDKKYMLPIKSGANIYTEQQLLY